MDGAQLFDIAIGGLNLLILIITAWIKIDVLSLKVYMHEKFVTRDEFERAIKALDHE